MLRLDAEMERLRAGRDLPEFDMSVMEAVAGLTLRLQDAREVIEREGAVIDDGRGVPVEHPAVKVERMASAELRGWVKDRPDLFGEQKDNRPRREKFGGFKAV